MIPILAAVTILLGFGLGRMLGSSFVPKVMASTCVVLSGLGAFYWQTPPFRNLLDILGYYYAVLMFAVFYLSAGALVGMLSRWLGRMVRPQ